MRHTILASVLAFSLISVHCGSSADPALIRHRIALVQAWHLTYASRLDPAESRPLQEMSTLKSVQVDRNLQFVDLTSDALRQRFGVPVVDDTIAFCGQIRIRATESSDGRIKYIDVGLYDASDELITKARVWNDTQATIRTTQETQGTQRDPHAYNRSIATITAERIADLLAGRKMDNDD